jgi:hypothetical protein
MEYRPVMPDVERARGQVGSQYIRGNPSHALSSGAEALASGFECGGRDVEHRELAVAGGQQVVHQSRFAATHVDDRGVLVLGSPMDVLQ